MNKKEFAEVLIKYQRQAEKVNCLSKKATDIFENIKDINHLHKLTQKLNIKSPAINKTIKSTIKLKKQYRTAFNAYSKEYDYATRMFAEARDLEDNSELGDQLFGSQMKIEWLHCRMKKD